MSPMHDQMRDILARDDGIRPRLHSPRKVQRHLRRRGFITALGNTSPKPPLVWSLVPTAHSPVHGFAWIGLDRETLIKVVALGFLPPRQRRPSVGEVWGFAMGTCRGLLVDGDPPVYFQEARETPSHIELLDPLHPAIRIPTRQRAETDDRFDLRFRCRATKMRWVTLLDILGNPVKNPNHSV